MRKGEIALVDKFSYNSYEFIERQAIQKVSAYTEFVYSETFKEKS